MMVASCRHFGYDVLQLSDETAPEITGVTEIQRVPMDCPQVLYRYRRLAEVAPPYLSLDVDLFLVRDVADGFMEAGYDAVLTRRETDTGMVYNGGVFAVHNSAFIRDCVTEIEGMCPEWQNWTGGQRAMVAVAPRYKVKELPCEVWNCSPVYLDDPRSKGAHILHFKGPRKEWMARSYASFYP